MMFLVERMLSVWKPWNRNTIDVTYQNFQWLIFGVYAYIPTSLSTGFRDQGFQSLEIKISLKVTIKTPVNYKTIVAARALWALIPRDPNHQEEVERNSWHSVLNLCALGHTLDHFDGK